LANVSAVHVVISVVLIYLNTSKLVLAPAAVSAPVPPCAIGSFPVTPGLGLA